MNKIFISKNNGMNNTAGSKARNDVEKILLQNGYKEVNTALAIPSKIPRKIAECIRFFAICKFEKDSIIVHQYPNLPYIFNFFLNKSKIKNKFKVITVVHDLSIRADQTMINNDKLQHYVFNFSDCIIVHNEFMKSYMIEKMHVVEKKIVVLGIFDYLIPEVDFKKNKPTYGNIVIAGNLDKSKSEYIYKLKGTTKKLKYNLYGPNYNFSYDQDNVCYNGSFPPDELHKNMDGSWGLVWDGSEVETCAGSTGDYLMVNNPHKTSLYIASGIPVIVWKQSAIAKFIEEKKLGLLIDSLYDIEKRINSLSDAEYAEIQKNVITESEKLRHGYYMSNALKRAVGIINES